MARFLLCLLLVLTLAPAAALHAQTTGGSDAPPLPELSLPQATVASPVPVGTLAYVADARGKLATVDLNNGAVKVVGSMGTVMSDIAFAPNGTLYGISFTKLFRIDPKTAKVTTIASTGRNDLNALECPSNTSCFTFGFRNSALLRITPSSGHVATVGASGGIKSAGDLVVHEGSLFLSSSDKRLVKLNASTGAVISKPLHNLDKLFGLVTAGTNKLFAFARTKLYLMNDTTAAPTLLRDLAGKGIVDINGAARKP